MQKFNEIYIEYSKMHVYKLLRSEKIDKKGRPAILLAYLGEDSLVWVGTTKINENFDTPIEIDFGEKKSLVHISSRILSLKTTFKLSLLRPVITLLL